MVQRLETRPVVWAEYQNEGWEVERGVIAHVFIGACLRCVDVKVDDLLVDVISVLECCDEWTNVLESCTSYQS